MTQAWQVAFGRDIPLTISSNAADIELDRPTRLRIGGGSSGEALLTDGAGDLYWSIPTAGGSPPEAPLGSTTYGRQNAAWIPVIPLTGAVMTGLLTLSANPITALQAVTKQYADNLVIDAGTY